MHTQCIDEIYLRLNVIDRRAAWTSDRASIQLGGMLAEIGDRIETYLDDEIPGWRTDKKLGKLFH